MTLEQPDDGVRERTAHLEPLTFVVYLFEKLKVEKNYRGYLISAWVLPVTVTDDEWYSPRGGVYQVEPSGRRVEVVRFESKEIFKSRTAAEDKGLKLCRQWIDEKAGNEPH